MSKLILLSACLLVSSGCHDEHIAKLERQNQEVLKELERQKKTVDLDLQGKCATAAKAVFHEQYRADKDTLLLDYRNHYNNQLGKCFVEIFWNYKDTPWHRGQWFRKVYLYDALEHDLYAELGEHSEFNPETNEFKISVITCTVTGVECRSRTEFEASIRRYIEN
jgi:hypothetical protein